MRARLSSTQEEISVPTERIVLVGSVCGTITALPKDGIPRVSTVTWATHSFFQRRPPGFSSTQL